MSRHGQCKRGLLLHTVTTGIQVMTPTERCSVSHKLRFPTQDAADRASQEFAEANRFQQTYSYHCEHCFDWHLTSYVRSDSRVRL